MKLQFVFLTLSIFYILHVRQVLTRCEKHFTRHINKIIDFKKSTSLGAFFIQPLHYKTSLTHCSHLCCKMKDCTVYVFEKKMKTCALFNCEDPDNCIFKDDENFILGLDRHIFKANLVDMPIRKANFGTLNEPCDNHSDCIMDNAGCHSNKCVCNNGYKSTKSGTCEEYRELHQKCISDKDCTTKHSVCEDECICRENYVEKYGGCVVSKCESSRQDEVFQCADTRESPFCIDAEDRCNGVVDCKDESDEKDCEATKNNDQTISSKAVDFHTTVKPKLKSSSNNSSSHPAVGNTMKSSSSNQKPSSEMLLRNQQQIQMAMAVLTLSIFICVALVCYFIIRICQRRNTNFVRRRSSQEDEDYLVKGLYL